MTPTNTNTAGNERVSELEEELRSEREMRLRALADFENYRKRVERDRAAAARSAKREILLSLLDVMDGFDRALEHMTQAPTPVMEGFQALRRKLSNLLQAQGVAPLQTLGQEFNPALHEAIGSMASEEMEAGTVAEEVQRGYVWGEEVLRPARVRVAR